MTGHTQHKTKRWYSMSGDTVEAMCAALIIDAVVVVTFLAVIA